MKRLFIVCLVVFLGGRSGRAGPIETSIMAIMRLSEQPSYSWVATVSDDARTYDIHGKTTRGGFTRVKMPVINTVRRQLGRSVTDTQIDLIFRGNVDCVIETDHGWFSPRELPLSPPEAFERDEIGAPAAGVVSSPRRRSPRSSGIQPPRAPTTQPADRMYSNLQLGLSHPHEELGVIVSSHQTLNVDGDIVTGELTNLGAQLLLVRDGQENIVPLRATGTFKIWLRDGMVAKYQVKLEGLLQVSLPASRREIRVQQVTDTIVTDVGTTVFEIPAPARAKLGG